jgi:hypothetical protein
MEGARQRPKKYAHSLCLRRPLAEKIPHLWSSHPPIPALHKAILRFLQGISLKPNYWFRPSTLFFISYCFISRIPP